MPGIYKAEKMAKCSLYEIGYKYLCDNFHKFNEANKIKVSIAILNIFEKDGSKSKSDMRQIVVMNDVVKNGQPVRYNFERTEDAGATEDSGQTRPDINQPQ